MATTRNAAPAEASAAAPASVPVHTSAQDAKPAHHQPTPRPPRDQYTGRGGTYARNPATGERTPVTPAAEPGESAAPAA